MELSNLMELLLLVPLVAAVVMAIIPSKSANDDFGAFDQHGRS